MIIVSRNHGDCNDLIDGYLCDCKPGFKVIKGI